MGKENLTHIDPDIEEVKALKEFASEQKGKHVITGGKFSHSLKTVRFTGELLLKVLKKLTIW